MSGSQGADAPNAAANIFTPTPFASTIPKGIVEVAKIATMRTLAILVV
jgi:hypothetical protein